MKMGQNVLDAVLNVKPVLMLKLVILAVVLIEISLTIVNVLMENLMMVFHVNSVMLHV